MNELEDAFLEVCAPEYYIHGLCFFNTPPVLENICQQMMLIVWLQVFIK